MGTSTNQYSPSTPRWAPVAAMLGSAEWSVDRQSQEVWRAAIGDREGRLTAELSDSLVAGAGDIAEARMKPAAAMQSFDSLASEKYAAGLWVDISRRALVRASAVSSGATGFASELFAETVAYYVSRDLPSYIGGSKRVQTNSQAIELKESIRKLAREISLSSGAVHTDLAGWRQYVSVVLTALQRSRSA